MAYLPDFLIQRVSADQEDYWTNKMNTEKTLYWYDLFADVEESVVTTIAANPDVTTDAAIQEAITTVAGLYLQSLLEQYIILEIWW